MGSTKGEVAVMNAAYLKKKFRGYSAARLRGIIKGILVDRVINQKEYPFAEAAAAHYEGGRAMINKAAKKYTPNVTAEQKRAAEEVANTLRHKTSVAKRNAKARREANKRREQEQREREQAAAAPPRRRRAPRRSADALIAQQYLQSQRH